MLTVASFTPPRLPGGEVGHLGLPAVALRVAQVQSEQLRREEARLVAAGAGADLEDDVLLVVRVLRDEEELELLLGGLEPRAELRELLLRHLAEVRVLLGEERLVVLDVLQELPVRAERVHGRLDRGALLRDLLEALAGRGDGRVGELVRQLLEPLLDGVELPEDFRGQHGGDVLPSGAGAGKHARGTDDLRRARGAVMGGLASTAQHVAQRLERACVGAGALDEDAAARSAPRARDRRAARAAAP